MRPWRTTLRAGKERGIFSLWDFRSELEYGVTDSLTTALYLNFRSLHQDRAGDAEDRDEFRFEGVSWEWKYKFSDPTADPLGFLLYGEATSNFQDVELEEKVVLGKELGRAVLALNFIAEEEWEFVREAGEAETEKELALEVYRVVPLPAGCKGAPALRVASARSGGEEVPTRSPQVVVEETRGGKFLHVRVPLAVRVVDTPRVFRLMTKGMVIDLDGKP